MSVTENDILREIEAFLAARPEAQNEPGTFTGPELGRALALGAARYKRVIDELLAAGRIEPAMVWRVDRWGRRTQYPGYRLLPT